MKEHEYQNAVRELTFYFLGAPAIILIGMFVIGAIIDSFLNTNETFSKLFLYIGGIPGISAYYYKRWKDFNNSNLNIKTNESINQILVRLNNTLEKLDNKLK